ncbi:hypothetical protein [Janthinobacterium aquaticum]|uniref:hypothetical protein n=1 Tax=Janthinobacterium sp. FT58W TaxID=2654254 RepID=UPI00186B1CAD|nr:hypothetical protein [Janthinobacterium sp. FT58W]
MRDQPGALASPATRPQAAQPLFRQQTLEHLSTRQYGTVILARPVSHLLLTLLFLAITLGIIAFFIFFSTTRKAQSQGVLLPTSAASPWPSNRISARRMERAGGHGVCIAM